MNKKNIYVYCTKLYVNIALKFVTLPTNFKNTMNGNED